MLNGSITRQPHEPPYTSLGMLDYHVELVNSEPHYNTLNPYLQHPYPYSKHAHPHFKYIRTRVLDEIEVFG